jgi:hypothetical protein
MKHRTPSPDAHHLHAVRFYSDRDSLCRIVAAFIGDGVVAGHPALVVGTREHRAGVVAHLAMLSLDAETLQRTNQLLLLDAEETLSRFMVDGAPDAARFKFAMTESLNRLCRQRTDCRVRCYGEMVDLLWQQGHTSAAIRLEILWNHLANTHAFALLCGYSLNNIYKDSAISSILSQHTHAVSDTGEMGRLADPESPA